MAGTISKYRCFCTDENKLVYQWSQTTPTKCPNNASHTIDSDSITIIDSVSTNTVVITDSEHGKTQENFMLEGFNKTAPANTLSKYELTYQYPIAVYNVDLKPSSDNLGDVVESYIVAYGATATSYNDNYIVFSDVTIMTQFPLGIFLFIDDEIVGRMISVDKTTNRLYIDRVINTVLPSLNVEFRMYLVCNVTFSNTNNILVGGGKVGGKVVGANTPIVVTYNNKANTEKNFIFDVQYLY